MGARIRAFDWASTPLGPVAEWPVSLRTIVATVYCSRHPMFLFWGPEHIGLYNDAYRQSLGPDRHPSALGRPGRETWAEIWDTIGPQIEAVMERAESTWHEDQWLPITRGDHVEDVYWSYSYSPVPDESGAVCGVLVTVQETTRRVYSERRLRLVQEVVDREMDATTLDEACIAAASVLADHPEDVPCGLFYLRETGGPGFRLAGAFGVVPGSDAAPYRLDAPQAHAASLVEAHGRGIREAVVVPLGSETGPELPGFFIAGVNPRVRLDEDYRGFLAQLAREVGTSLDIIQARDARQRAARQAAEAERALLARTFELSPTFLAILRGPEHVFELVNPAYERLVGGRDLIGRRVSEALPEATRQGFGDLLDRVYQTGEPFVGNEVRVQVEVVPGQPLEDRYLNFVYQPLHDAEGRVTGIHVNGVDVSELVRQRQLVEREAAEHDAERRQLLTVLAQSPLAIIIYDPGSRRLLFSNPAASELLGYDVFPEDFSTLDADWRRLHPDGRVMGPGEAPLARALAERRPVTNEILVVEHVRTGRRVEIAETAAPVRDAQGNVIAAVAIFSDVTAERVLERQLREAERMQAVGTLAGGVAHEINNQMTAVLGFGAFVLKALGPDHPQAPDMRVVLQSAERAARISQQLLAFSRQQVTRREVLDLGALVTDAAPVLKQLLGADKLLTVAPAVDLPPVSADKDQVQQVLINLVANARDATDTGAHVDVRVEEAVVTVPIAGPSGENVVPGRYVRISVEDTGHGMTTDVLVRIFDPFFTTKGVGEGTGLGLPMVYGTLRRHGGYVVARSAPGEGTVVDLYWPVMHEPSAVADGSTDAGVPRGRPGSRVLVAEDEPAVRELAVRILEDEGYRTLAVEDGAAALEVLRTGRFLPDLVITDVIMPRVNGRQLSDAVRSDFPEVPVVFMSGHAGEEALLQRLIPAGAPFLPKPFTPDDLLRITAATLAQ